MYAVGVMKSDPGAHSPLSVHELCSFVTRLLFSSTFAQCLDRFKHQDC